MRAALGVAMVKPTLIVLSALSSIVLTGISAGCTDAIERAYDCHVVCQTYADCVDSTYDVGACTDRCEHHAADDQDFARQADSCQQCVDDRACSENWPCIDNCVGLVP